MEDKEYIRNLILAIVLAITAVFAIDWLFPNQDGDNKVGQVNYVAETAKIEEEELTSASLVDTASQALPEKELSIKEALAISDRVNIKNSFISGSIKLQGARIDDISLLKYRETLEPESPNIVLFAPTGTAKPKYAEFGWVSSDKNILLPDSHSVWQADKDALSENEPVTLTWENGQGLKFIRTLSIDDKYMITVKEKVENTSGKAVTLNHYGAIRQIGGIPESGAVTYVSYAGPIAVMDNTLEDVGYEELIENGKETFTTSEGGWIGITEKYWLSALIFPQDARDVKGNFVHSKIKNNDIFQTDYMLVPVTIDDGKGAETVSHLFVGAKDINTLDDYAQEYNIAYLDKAIDFGWYYFLTKPFLYILNFLNSFLGNMGLAILLFAFLLRLLVFPIANKSYVSMQKMKLLQPKIKELNERYKNDRQHLSMEMMNLYKKEKVNPASGCLPALIQIPIFFSLYKVLYISIEMRQAPFYGWIHDLSAPDPTSVFTLCGLIDWPIPDFLNIGIWPVIMGITMFIQFKLNPAPADKMQVRVFMLMPVIFTFMLAHFASGLVIYWAWSNILAIIQQKTIIYGMDKKLKAHTKLKDIE